MFTFFAFILPHVIYKKMTFYFISNISLKRRRKVNLYGVYNILISTLISGPNTIPISSSSSYFTTAKANKFRRQTTSALAAAAATQQQKQKLQNTTNK
jgi:hypothetical protein